MDSFGFSCIYLALIRLPVVSAAARGRPAPGDPSGLGLLAEASGLDGEMSLVLEARVVAPGQERDNLGDRAADGIDPARLGFREVIQDIVMESALSPG